jgi:hypothetical protein
MPMPEQANRYSAFGGRVFGVEQDKSLRWWAVGRQRGHQPYVLDRLGWRPTREQMQGALDGWAARQGLRPIGQAAASGRGACAGEAQQAELWVCQ